MFHANVVWLEIICVGFLYILIIKINIGVHTKWPFKLSFHQSYLHVILAGIKQCSSDAHDTGKV